MKRQTFKVPNRLICDDRLSPSARKVGVVLYAHRNHLGVVYKSQEMLGELSGLCPATVRKATEELSAAGYVTAAPTRRYLEQKHRVVYGRKVYQLSLGFQGGYTLVPRAVVARRDDLTPAAFLVCMGLFVAAGNRRRAFPSLTKLSALVGVTVRTVCRALEQIKRLPWIVAQLCKKRSGAYAASSYHFADVAPEVELLQVCDVLTEAACPAEQLADTGRTSGFRRLLRTLILRAGEVLGKFFPPGGVLTNLANRVRT